MSRMWKGTKFKQTLDTEKKFQVLKEHFLTAPLQNYLDYTSDEPFILDMDWSTTNMAAILSQVQDRKERFFGAEARKCCGSSEVPWSRAKFPISQRGTCCSFDGDSQIWTHPEFQAIHYEDRQQVSGILGFNETQGIYAGLGIRSLLIRSFAQIAQNKWATLSDLLRTLKNKWATVSESLRSLMKHERSRVIRSGHSDEMSNLERITQVAHQKWAIPSGYSAQKSEGRESFKKFQ